MVDVVNFYVVEYLIIQMGNVECLVDVVCYVGLIFVGFWVLEVVGDYVVGLNYILLIGGVVWVYGGVMVEVFQKMMIILWVSEVGVCNLVLIVEWLVVLEGLDVYCLVMVKCCERVFGGLVVVEGGLCVVVCCCKIVEMDIVLLINFDWDGFNWINIGVGYFDYMLDQIVWYVGILLFIDVEGDLEIDVYYIIEDVCLIFGEVFVEVFGDKCGIVCFGFELLMDEIWVGVWIDFLGCFYVKFEGEILGD